MRVNLHIGMHFTRTARLVKAMRENEKVNANHGVISPPVKSYRTKINAELARLDGLPPTRDESRALVSQIMGEGDVRSAILIDEAWSGKIETAFADEMLYSNAGENVRRVVELFQTEDVRLSMALINPATYIAGVLSVKRAVGQARWFVRNVDPASISWKTTVDRLLAEVTDIPVTLWAEEDTPLVWARILRNLGELPQDTEIRAPYAALREVLTPEGMTLFKTFIEKFPPKSPQTEERAIMAFLDKYSAAPVYDPEDGLEGWDAEALATITERYEADIATLAEHPRVTLIQPHLTNGG